MHWKYAVLKKRLVKSIDKMNFCRSIPIRNHSLAQCSHATCDVQIAISIFADSCRLLWRIIASTTTSNNPVQNALSIVVFALLRGHAHRLFADSMTHISCTSKMAQERAHNGILGVRFEMLTWQAGSCPAGLGREQLLVGAPAAFPPLLQTPACLSRSLLACAAGQNRTPPRFGCASSAHQNPNAQVPQHVISFKCTKGNPNIVATLLLPHVLQQGCQLLWHVAS